MIDGIPLTFVLDDAVMAGAFLDLILDEYGGELAVVGIFDESQRNPDEVKVIADIFISDYNEINLF